MAQDYNSTLNLPQTEFSMRGNLVQKEPAMLENWESERTYYEMIKKNDYFQILQYIAKKLQNILKA